MERCDEEEWELNECIFSCESQRLRLIRRLQRQCGRGCKIIRERYSPPAFVCFLGVANQNVHCACVCICEELRIWSTVTCRLNRDRRSRSAIMAQLFRWSPSLFCFQGMAIIWHYDASDLSTFLNSMRLIIMQFRSVTYVTNIVWYLMFKHRFGMRDLSVGLGQHYAIPERIWMKAWKINASSHTALRM